MQEFLSQLHPELDRLNRVVRERLDSRVPLVEEIGEHLIAAGGKRLRPLLSIISAKSLAYEADELFQLAAVIEFLHTATLLHDDVIDVSELRRGRPTANAMYGNAPSVLVGDFLYSRAFQMLVEIGNMEVMEELANTTNTIAEGEVLQLTKAGDPGTTEQEYLRVIHYKTARLFEAAGRCAAILADGDQTQRDDLATYGYNIGMAFQLMDDVLDYQGDPAIMGKNVGDDLSEGKPTLPLIYAMQASSDSDAELIRTAIAAKSSEHLVRITQTVTNSGALDYTVSKALEYSNQAVRHLGTLLDTPYRQSLNTLAQLAVQRQM